jgi:hypothetical protein
MLDVDVDVFFVFIGAVGSYYDSIPMVCSSYVCSVPCYV